ncbi:MAG: hypothetical protein ACOYJU_03675 [Anaerovoracaceae bacterium]|jgi:hypothetical protein
MKKRNHYILAVAMVVLLAICVSGCNKGSSGKTVEVAPLGTWIETKQESERDGKLYPMKYRITEVDRDKASVDKKIEEYNHSAMGNTIEPLASENLEYAVAEYEAYYPKDFPDDEFGITAVAVKFSIASVEGKPDITVDGTKYKGLATTWEIGAPPMGYDFYSDSTYKGSILFVMVKGSDEYVFEEKYNENGKDVVHYTEGK